MAAHKPPMSDSLEFRPSLSLRIKQCEWKRPKCVLITWWASRVKSVIDIDQVRLYAFDQFITRPSLVLGLSLNRAKCFLISDSPGTQTTHNLSMCVFVCVWEKV